jgi:phospholipase D1/2
MDQPRARAWPLQVVALVAPVVALAAVWLFADLSSFQSASDVGRTVRAIGEGPLGFLYVPFGFACGTLVFLPVTALIGGTALAFEPWRGFAYAMSGALLGAALAYGVGKLAGGSLVDRLNGARMTKFREQLRTHAFRSAVIIHILPFGSFTVVNLLAGSLRMPFGGFMAGTFVGLLPGIIFFTFLAGRVPAAIRSPTPLNVLVLLAGVAGMIALGWLLRRWARRREHRGATA